MEQNVNSKGRGKQEKKGARAPQPSDQAAAQRGMLDPSNEEDMGHRTPTYPDIGGQIQPVKQTLAERAISWRRSPRVN